LPDPEEEFCHLTTQGRRSGNPHTVEIWFALEENTMYFLSGSGDGADWVRNILAHPRVRVKVASEELNGVGRIVEDQREEARARRLLAAKYQGWTEGRRLSGWASTALPVAVDLSSP
jgi:deazaflavin-dependent oxidoreductase (nitroreductase family)